MREEIESIFERYLYEFNDSTTRREIKMCIESYLLSLVNSHEILNFLVEDRTTIQEIDNGRMYFQVMYQKPNLMMHIMDVVTNGSTLKISDFEKNVVGKRHMKTLYFN